MATEERLRGYHAAAAAAGVRPDSGLVQHSDFRVDGGRAAALRLLGLPEPPSAIFAFNDSMAIGAMQAAVSYTHLDVYKRQMGAFIRVVIPAAIPGIVAVLIYAFMTAWSEMLFASVLTNDSTRTLAVGLQGYATQNQVYWNQIMAASLTVSVPIVVGFLLLQRFLVAGMTAGSVK